MQNSQSVEATTRQNVNWVHVMRFTAALLVVLAHVEGWGGYPYWAKTFYYTISRVGVPIFFMISGYLLLIKEEPISIFLKKRFTRVAIPFLAWSIIYDLVYSQPFVENGITLDGIGSLFVRIIRGPRGGHLWFLYFLIGLYIFTPVLRVFVSKAQKSDLLYYIGLWFFVVPFLNIVQALTPIQNGFEVYYVGGYLGYFLLGYFLGKQENTPQTLYIGIAMFGIGILWTFAVFYLDLPPDDNELVFRSYQSINIILMSLGAFIILKMVGEKANRLIVEVARQGGKVSFGIYLIHLLVLDVLLALANKTSLNVQEFNSIVIIPLVAVVAFLISWVVSYVIQKIPILRSIV